MPGARRRTASPSLPQALKRRAPRPTLPCAGDRGGSRCRTVAATPTGATGLALGPGEVTLRPRSGSSTQVLLGRFADGFPVPLGQLRAGRASSLTLPVDRSPRPWRLGLRGSGRATVCGQELVAVGRSAGGQQTTGPGGGNESAAKGERASPAAGTNETTSGPRPASSAANAFADGGDGGTSTLAPIVIAVGAVGLLLGGAWWARTGPLPLPTPPPAEARAAAEVAEAEESPGPAEAEVKTETTEEREAP